MKYNQTNLKKKQEDRLTNGGKVAVYWKIPVWQFSHLWIKGSDNLKIYGRQFSVNEVK